MGRRPVVRALLVLLLVPFWTGCYTRTSVKTSYSESITGREQQVVAERIDLGAPRRAASSDVEIAALDTKLCRTSVTGTRTEVIEEDNELSLWTVPLLAAPGAAMMVAGATAQSTDQMAALLFGGIGVFLAGCLTPLFLPSSRTSFRNGETKPISRLEGNPFPCKGVAPAGVPDLNMLAIVSFAKTDQKLTYAGKTDSAGVWRFSPTNASLTAGHCGDATALLAPAAQGFPKGVSFGGAATLKLEPAAAVEIARVAEQLGPASTNLARSCCNAAASAVVRDDCEERCARAGMVHNCLFARRACDLKASRAGPDVAEGKKFCGDQYEECIVANGTTVRNLASCVDACAAEQPMPAMCR